MSSRLKRLKDIRRKNKIKTTFCCLTLALAMGISQGIGTYALFTDNENVSSDISLSTGDVDVEVDNGKDFTDVKPGDEINIPIKITNNGTLNQNISLGFSVSDDIKQYLRHEFIFDGITIDNGVMYKGKELFVLAPGESITGETKVTVLRDVQNNLYETKKHIDITVKSTQINKNNTLSNKGFYDVAIQRNTITIATGEKAYSTNDHGELVYSGHKTTVNI